MSYIDNNLGFSMMGIAGVDEDTLNVLVKTSEHTPQIMGSLNKYATFATIEVWDLINGNNEPIVLASSGCYSVGDTTRWGWSIANLPAINNTTGQYLFRMTDSTGEVFEGEFFLTTPEPGQWKLPRDKSEYIK